MHFQVRLMYERVPRNKPALQQHLDDPVIEYVHVYRLEQEHYLTDLPMGKYIVCGEAHVEGEVVQSNCFETTINRLDNNSKLASYYLDRIQCKQVPENWTLNAYHQKHKYKYVNKYM